jgi:uncharacterized glyoxalase superfamily protein PhnB
MGPSAQTKTTMNDVVPFLSVADIEGSLRFYVDGLGFTMARHWLVDGRVRWCRLESGGAAIMLQEHHPGRSPEGKPGIGVSLNFHCPDALAFYDDARRQGLDASEPFVGNGMWVTSITDPDGYRIYVSSVTDAPEETELSEVRKETN